MKQLTRHVREASTPSLGQRRPKSLKLGAAAHGQVGDDGRSPARRRPSKGLSSRWPALRSPASAGDFDQAAPARQTAVMDARGTEHTTFSHCALDSDIAPSGSLGRMGCEKSASHLRSAEQAWDEYAATSVSAGFGWRGCARLTGSMKAVKVKREGDNCNASLAKYRLQSIDCNASLATHRLLSL